MSGSASYFRFRDSVERREPHSSPPISLMIAAASCVSPAVYRRREVISQRFEPAIISERHCGSVCRWTGSRDSTASMTPEIIVSAGSAKCAALPSSD
jgi:hypothetical protein